MHASPRRATHARIRGAATLAEECGFAPNFLVLFLDQDPPRFSGCTTHRGGTTWLPGPFWFVSIEIDRLQPDSLKASQTMSRHSLPLPFERSKDRNIGCCGRRARSRLCDVRCSREPNLIPGGIGPIGPMGPRKEAHGTFFKTELTGGNTLGDRLARPSRVHSGQSGTEPVQRDTAMRVWNDLSWCGRPITSEPEAGT